MAEQEEEQQEQQGNFWTRLNFQQKLGIGAGVAALIAIFIGLWIWGKAPDYRVLYSNLSDRDGGAIIASLQQQNIPYKFAEGGGALLVPADMVHEARLKLASQGLPKGGNVGFELMENQKFGTTQFAEQVNYQRALEGELARSVEAIGSVASARVHLAIPKPTVFIKEQQKPSASVILNLQPGRFLDPAQVSAIVHLISSSVPELNAKSVTVVDQNGTLLSNNHEGTDGNLSTTQLKYVKQVEQNYIQRIESLLTPFLGENNVRAQVTADIDFSRAEQTSENYNPNQKPHDSAVRSQQQTEILNGTGLTASGVPGSLTNQPPVPATAPIVSNANPSPNAASGVSISNLHKESTTNYEVDRTIRHTVLPVGEIKRLSVAVVVNGTRSGVDAKGKPINKPLTPDEKEQINKLVKEAMGFNQQRGDSMNVEIAPFTDKKSDDDLPFWKQPGFMDLVKEIVKYLIIGGIVLLVIFRIIKPALAPLLPDRKAEEEAKAAAAAAAAAAEAEAAAAAEAEKAEEENPAAIYQPSTAPYEQKLQVARQITQQDPKIVALVIKEWIANE